jgi:hypothetical protein
MERIIVYVESDDHGGNVRGLLNPETRLIDDHAVFDFFDLFGDNEQGMDTEDALTEVQSDPLGYNDFYYTPKLRAWQKYLWELRTQNLSKLVELANGDPIVYIHTGDMTQGQKYVADWVTTRIGDQFDIAYWNHKPIMELPNLRAARYVEGTGSHVFGDGTSEQVVTNRLKAEYPDIDIAASVHGLIDVYGFTIDYSHHGPGPGSRKWLQGNIASYYLRDRMMQVLLHGEDPPDLYLRAHFHTWVKAMWNVSVGEKDHTSHLCIVPSMCGIGAYGRQVTKSIDAVTNGALAFEVINGKMLDVYRWTRTVDIKRKETLR